MQLGIMASTAWWFLPFALPICLWVMFTDLKHMKIRNQAVIALAVVFMVIGLIALPFQDYLWRLATLVVVLLLGVVMNAARLMGAGDAKFIAAAAPFVDPADVMVMLMIFSASLLAAFGAHRLAKHTSLRKLAPHWDSWDRGKKFPMGLALGAALVIYLGLGALWGQ